MATNLAWYDSSFVALSGSQSIAGLPGTGGTPVTLVIINNKDGSGADTLLDARLKALFDDNGALVDQGTEWADRHYVEVRIKASGHWNLTLSQTDWQKLGTHRMLDIPTLGNDEGIAFEFRLNAPPDVLADAEAFQLRITDSPGEATSQGIQETYAGGIYSGAFDETASEIITTDDVIETGTPDRDANIQDTRWISAGKFYSAVAQAVNIPQATTDFERWDLLSLDVDGSGTITRTAGAEVTEGTGVVPDDYPATPAGNLPLCYVFAADVAAQPAVLDSNITNVWTESYFNFRVTSGLTTTLAKAPRAITDNSLLYKSGISQVTLTDDETNTMWLLRDGTIGVSIDGTDPGDRSLPLWEIVAASGSVTTTTDLRSWGGFKPHDIIFRWNGIVTDDEYRYHIIPNRRPGWILPIGIFASIGTQQVTASAGQFEWDVEVKYSGSWTTIFGTGSTLPQIAYDATDLRDINGAFPTRFDLPRAAEVRAKVDVSNLTGVGTNPYDAVLIIPCAI